MASSSRSRAGKLAKRQLALTIAAAFILPSLAPQAVYADPPPWAPAHGYRAKAKHKNKHKRRHGGYESYGEAYVVPHGISRNTCDRGTVGAVLGGVTGAVIGSQVVKRENAVVGLIGGAIVGVIVGGAIGRSMDRVDHNCIGQALEHAEEGQRVNWTNEDTGSRYSVTPKRTYQTTSGQYCREYQVTGALSGREQEAFGNACRQTDGTWKIIN